MLHAPPSRRESPVFRAAQPRFVRVNRNTSDSAAVRSRETAATAFDFFSPRFRQAPSLWYLRSKMRPFRISLVFPDSSSFSIRFFRKYSPVKMAAIRLRYFKFFTLFSLPEHQSQFSKNSFTVS